MLGWVPYNPVYVQLSEVHWNMYLWLQRWHHFGYLFGRFQPFFGAFLIIVVGTSPCSLPHLSGRKQLLSRGAGRGLSNVTSSGIWRCSGSTSPKIAMDDISWQENPPNFHECLWDKHEAFLLTEIFYWRVSQTQKKLHTEDEICKTYPSFPSSVQPLMWRKLLL